MRTEVGVEPPTAALPPLVPLLSCASCDCGRRSTPTLAEGGEGMTVSGQWWIENRQFDIETVAKHVAAIGWMGLRHIPKTPEFED